MREEAPTMLHMLNFTTILVMSIAFHEMAHAWSADRFGDDTPRRHGRLSLNPFVHLDPVMSLLVPIGLYYMTGWFVAAGSTPVNENNMRRPRLHGALCSLAGPLANVVMAGIFFVAATVVIVASGGIDESGAPSFEGSTTDVFRMAIYMNLFLFVFNLLPVPPLDGSHVLKAMLPLRAALWYASLQRYSMLFLIVLMLTGIAGDILLPIMFFMVEVVEIGLELVNGLARG